MPTNRVRDSRLRRAWNQELEAAEVLARRMRNLMTCDDEDVPDVFEEYEEAAHQFFRAHTARLTIERRD